MTWIRHDYNAKNTKWLLGFLMVLFFMAMVFLQFAAAAVTAFIAAIAGLQWLYFAKAGERLQFKNEKSRKRVLNGGDSAWELVFENKGLPIWGGALKIWFQDSVEPKGQNLKNYSDMIELDISIYNRVQSNNCGESPSGWQAQRTCAHQKNGIADSSSFRRRQCCSRI